MKTKTILQFALAFLAAPSIWASSLTYNFDSPTGSLGTSQNYTSDAVTITAYGYNSFNNLINLYGKAGGGDENGLGLAGNSPNFEITTTTYVQLDLKNLWAADPTAFAMTLGSVQSGEGWKIYGSNTAGSLGTLLLSGTSEASQVFGTIPSGYEFIGVQASSVDVLLSSLSATVPDVPPSSITPEPSSLLMIGSGLLALAFVRRGKRTS